MNLVFNGQTLTASVLSKGNSCYTITLGKFNCYIKSLITFNSPQQRDTTNAKLSIQTIYHINLQDSSNRRKLY